MKKEHAQGFYGPLKEKTFRAALARELSEQIPSLGPLLAERLSAHLEQLVHRYFPERSHLRMGQILWPAVDEKETVSYGKRIDKYQLIPVCLDLLTAEDIQDLLNQVPKRQRRQKIALRLFRQAKAQGGVLSEPDVGFMLQVSASCISLCVKEYEKQTGQIVPRRGTVHDMGPSVSHKIEICRRIIIEGQSVEACARQTNHSPEAITRYVQNYRRVLTCLKNGFSLTQTAYATNLSKKLVGEYEELIKKKCCKSSKDKVSNHEKN